MRFLLVLFLASLVAREAMAADGLIREPYAIEITAERDIKLPAGSAWSAPSGELYVSLRAAEQAVSKGTSAVLQVPSVALSSKASWFTGAHLTPTDAPKEAARLQPLFVYLATRNDVPRETSQLVALALMEDIAFPSWQQSRGKAAPSTADLASALDALTILRAIAPEKTFALASDPALKLATLHDPALRPKALQLYGLAIPGDAAAGATPPDLGQLLHTKPGDNCPICRLRAQMQAPAETP